ncbi:hypothetical protein QE357_004460 [Siphonobacter sp. BAB-5404]|nr:hypothetical protein [Siphonobacter sp. SORGH_AS_0500]
MIQIAPKRYINKSDECCFKIINCYIWFYKSGYEVLLITFIDYKKM